MVARKIHDTEGHAHFLTFSCYRRRRLLHAEPHKRIVISLLSSELVKQKVECIGFVIMPDHVHSIIIPPEPNQISYFVRIWKQRTSRQIKSHMKRCFVADNLPFKQDDPIWQRKYYDFNIFSDEKIIEKLNYMHNNPVRAGFVARPEDWPYGSARWYVLGKSVGLRITPPC